MLAMKHGKHLGGLLAAALASIVACSQPPPDNSPDPCALLTAECPYCTQSAAQETCQTASATGDDVQCTVALDDQNVQTYCVVPDGGGDASLDGAADATLPVCNASVISPDGGCACASPCVSACPTGGCTITCPSGGTCSPSCEGGGCTIDCKANATCEASCAGGGCVFVCEAGSNCANSCTGGQCAFQCADGSVCNDTCATTPPCTGP
jgi:hypothetical protein